MFVVGRRLKQRRGGLVLVDVLEECGDGRAVAGIHLRLDRVIVQIGGLPHERIHGRPVLWSDDHFVFHARMAIDGFLADFGPLHFRRLVGFSGRRACSHGQIAIGLQPRINQIAGVLVRQHNGDGLVHSHRLHLREGLRRDAASLHFRHVRFRAHLSLQNRVAHLHLHLVAAWVFDGCVSDGREGFVLAKDLGQTSAGIAPRSAKHSLGKRGTQPAKPPNVTR